MERIEYKTKSGVKQFRPRMTKEEYQSACNEYQGFCLSCGSEAFGVEPDARGYSCESCELNKVYGLEELLVMALLEIK